MSFSNTNVNITYDGNGADQSFGINFHYLKGVTTVIQVELWDYTDPDLPTKESFVLNVDYTIDESGYPNTLVNTTDPVAVDFKLIIYRQSVPVQTTIFVNGAFPAESVEEGLDKNMMVAQEYVDTMSRAIINPIGGPSVSIEELIEAAGTVGDFEARIAHNELDISVSQGLIATNNSAIGANTAAIGSNATNIAANTSNIAGLGLDYEGNKWTTDIISTSGTHPALARSVVILKADNITMNLPIPVDGKNLKIKMDGMRSGCIIQSAAGIDGFGTSYTLLSSYESVSLVSDGTTWYII